MNPAIRDLYHDYFYDNNLYIAYITLKEGLDFFGYYDELDLLEQYLNFYGTVVK